MENPTCKAGQSCLVCRLEIKPPEEDSLPLSVRKQIKIFNVLKTYIKWEGVRKTFQFRKDLFPFCQSCTSVISRIWELNENVEELLRQIQQLTTNLCGKILLSHYRDDDSVVVKEEVNEVECFDSNVKKLNLEKIESYRNVTIKRFTPKLELLRLDGSGNANANNEEIKNKTNSEQLGSRVRKTKKTKDRVLTSAVVLKDQFATKDLNVEAVSGDVGREFEDLVTFLNNENNHSQHEKLEIDGTIQNDDDYGEELLDPDYHPPSPATSKENETGENIRDEVHSKTSGRAKKRRGEKLQPKKVRKQKPYRLVEISPNLFVHADKYRIKKLSDNLYECLECTASKFSTKLSASRHAYFHSCRDAKRYQCGVCEKAFANKSSFDKHKRTPCKKKDFKCDICGTRFIRRRSVKPHMKKHHNKSSTDNSQEKKPASSVAPEISSLNCAESLEPVQGSDLNMSSFKGSNDIEIQNQDDYQSAPGNEIAVTPSEIELKAKQRKKPQSAGYKMIEVSPNLFKYKDKYLAQKFADNWYECLECHKYYTTFSSLCKHVYFHYCLDLSRYRCDVCDKVFPSKNALDQHLHSHSNEKSFMCELCGYAFVAKRRLHLHIKNCHSEYKRHRPKNVVCDYCGKAFISESMLKRHLTIHTGVVVKPVSCEICGKVLSKYKMKDHMIRHGPPKFSCSECDKAFHMITTFNNHMKVIHGGIKAFSCDECGKSFSYKESIVYHKNRYHSERSAELNNKRRKLPQRGTGIYPCDQCGKLFYRKDSIKGHKKRFHSELTAELDRQLKEKLSRRKNKEH